MSLFLSSLVGSYAGTLIQKHKEERDRQDKEREAELGLIQSAMRSGQLSPDQMNAAFKRSEEIISEYTHKKKGGFSLGNLIGKFQDVGGQPQAGAAATSGRRPAGGAAATAPAAQPPAKVNLGQLPSRSSSFMLSLPQSDQIDDSSSTRANNFQRNRAWSKSGPYTTKLSPQQEIQFEDWVSKNGIPWTDTPDADYDMRGFWLAMRNGDPTAVRSAKNHHFPDRWKTPYDATFSNQSQYALPNAPHWDGNRLVLTPSQNQSVNLGQPPARTAQRQMNLGAVPSAQEQPFSLKFTSPEEVAYNIAKQQAKGKLDAADEDMKRRFADAVSQAMQSGMTKLQALEWAAPIIGIKTQVRPHAISYMGPNGEKLPGWQTEDGQVYDQNGQVVPNAVEWTAPRAMPTAKLKTVGSAPFSITEPNGKVWTKSDIKNASPEIQRQWQDAEDTYQQNIRDKAAQQARQNALVLDRMTSADQRRYVFKELQDYRPVQQLYDRMAQTMQQVEKQGFITGPQSTLLLAGHMGVTMGQVKGMRTTIQWIRENAAARPWDQSVQVAIQKVSEGGIISMDQARQFLGQVKDSADVQRETIEQDASAYGVKISLPPTSSSENENEIIGKLLNRYAPKR